MKPSVGRNVHYHLNSSGAPLHAQIAAVTQKPTQDAALYPDEEDSYIVNMAILSSMGDGWTSGVNIPFSPTPKAGHWSWPPRV